MLEQRSFGYWLRLKRKALDLTRAGLADRVGCSVSTIRKLEIDTELKFWDGIGHAYGELGNLSRYQGNYDQAEQFYVESLRVH